MDGAYTIHNSDQINVWVPLESISPVPIIFQRFRSGFFLQSTRCRKQMHPAFTRGAFGLMTWVYCVFVVQPSTCKEEKMKWMVLILYTILVR
jgi:hypothetical protein